MNNNIVKLVIVAFLACINQACTTSENNSDSATITIRPLDKNHIKVEYSLPADCTNVPLLNPYGNRTRDLRKDWQSLDGCGELSAGDSLIRKNQCKTLNFSVPIEAKIVDRVNPVAYPLDEKGVLVHTATFAIDNSCGDVTWNFLSPDGSLIVDGNNLGENATFQQAKDEYIKYTGVFFSYKSIAGDAPVIFTESVPDSLRAGIKNASSQVSDYYIQTYSNLVFLSPALFISNTIQPDSFGFQADVSSPRMIRFGFFNWKEEQLSTTLGVVAHEYAHILQPAEFIKQAGAPVISEGGAEFMRWMAGYRMGWRDKNHISQELSNALHHCHETINDRPWSAIKDNEGSFGLAPYTCGLAIHVLSLASRKNPESAEKTLENFYTKAGSDITTDIAQALECGALENCQPGFLNDFFNSEESASKSIFNQLNRLELVVGVSYAQKGKSLASLSQKSFSRLMEEDCDGIDFWTLSDKFITGKTAKCNSLPHDVNIISVEGISYFAEPLKAIEAQNKGCLTKNRVTLGMENNEILVVSCSKSFEPEKNYYEIDIDKLLSLLK